MIHNLKDAPVTTFIGLFLIAATVYSWLKNGVWNEGHTAVSGLGVAMLFSPDRLKPKDPPQCP